MSKEYLDDNGLLYLWQSLKNKFLRTGESHASSSDTYGKGTSSNYGHVKLSDATDGTSAAASGGTAATPKAVADGLTAAKNYTDGKYTGVSDVQVGGSSVVSSGVASIPAADSSNKGVMKLYTSTGDSTDGTMDRNSITTALGNKVNTSSVGANSGVCPLDSSGLVASQYLPSYVDDVIEAYPVTGATELSAGWLSKTSGGTALTPETGKVYILMADSTSYDTNTQFRWSGSTYVELAGGGISAITNAEIDDILDT